MGLFGGDRRRLFRGNGIHGGGENPTCAEESAREAAIGAIRDGIEARAQTIDPDELRLSAARLEEHLT